MPEARPSAEQTRRRRRHRGSLCAPALVLCLTASGSAASLAARRELALKYYEQAVAQQHQIEALPKDERDPAAYQKVINLFRRVYLTSPQSSRADDSLLAVAEMNLEMSRRFGSAAYRDKAVEAYRFLIREYPYSRLAKQARKEMEELEASPEPTAKREPEPAESAAVSKERPPEVRSEPPAPAAETSPPPAGKRLPLVTDVRHWSFPGSTRVIVDLEAEVPIHSDRLTNPDRIYFDLPSTRLAPALKGKSFPIGDNLVKQVRVAQTQVGVTRVVVDLAGDAEHNISVLPNPPRVVVELRERPQATAAVAAVAAPPRPEPVPATPPAKVAKAVEPVPLKLAPPKAALPDSLGHRNLTRALGLKVGRVVIDPGHGGHDTGTIGPSGLMEKDLALDVATRLGALVSERIGSEVLFTRTEDTFIPLEERTGLANEKQADLFISIHANSSRLPGSRGIETYYMNLTADREALEVAARENAASQKSIHELQDLVSKITLTEKVAESREFATQVQRSMHATLALRNRGVRKAPFLVLIGARMPSVLAEISFLSNPRDEKLLKTPAYRQKVAQALFKGLAGYAQTLSRMEVAKK